MIVVFPDHTHLLYLHCNCCAPPPPPQENLTKAPRGRQGNAKLLVRNKVFACLILFEIEVIEYGKIGFKMHSQRILFHWGGSGMKVMTAPRCRAEICRTRNKFSLSRFTKRCNSIFFFVLSFYHLQIVLLTSANNKIH